MTSILVEQRKQYIYKGKNNYFVHTIYSFFIIIIYIFLFVHFISSWPPNIETIFKFTNIILVSVKLQLKQQIVTTFYT